MDVPVLTQLAARPDGVAYHAHLALARLLRDRGERARANVHYAEALSRWADPGVRREHATNLEQVGDVPAALTAWQQALPDAAAVEAIARLAEPAVAAAAFRRVRLHRDALRVVEQAQTPAGILERARARASLRELAAAITDFAAYLRLRPDDGTARAEYAWALERNGQLDAAFEQYGRLGAGGQAGRGRVLEARGRIAEAITAFLASPDAEARWRGAVLLEREGNSARALEVYAQLAASGARVADEAALRAHLTHARAGRQAEAGAFAAQLSPGLAWLAGVHAGNWPTAGSEQPGAVPALEVATALARDFGLDWARIEVEVALRGAAPAQQIAIGQWFVAQGLYHRAVWIGMSLLPRLPTPEVYRLAYPRAFEELVLEWAQRYQVDPFLVWAVMREESHFQPEVMSWADARGLMQVIPSTGAWIAQRLGEEFVLEELFDPATSIRYGTWYLSNLLEVFNGNATLAIAAYNGGRGSVQRWMGSPLYRDTVDLPGVAAFRETREYIGKVLASWLAFRWIYGESPPELPPGRR
jgi:soluble lytic murein transglycosylase